MDSSGLDNCAGGVSDVSEFVDELENGRTVMESRQSWYRTVVELCHHRDVDCRSVLVTKAMGAEPHEGSSDEGGL